MSAHACIHFFMTSQTQALPLKPLYVILKYQFQYHSDDTLTSNKVKGICKGICKIGEHVQNSVKKADFFMTATYVYSITL